MSTVGQREILTQQRVIAFFRDALGYAYLGDWQDRPDNRNIEQDLLTGWLKRQGHPDGIIAKVLRELNKAAALGGSTDTLRRQPRGLRPAPLRGQGPAGYWRAAHHCLAD